MGFRTARGRPKAAHSERRDEGTPELRRKRRDGLTAEPLDALLRSEGILPLQHRAGVHFRWLYTLCHGAPSPTSLQYGADAPSLRRDESAQWRAQREEDYRAAALLLQGARLLRAVQDCCVYQEMPADEAALARLRKGLDVLSRLWGLRSA